METIIGLCKNCKILIVDDVPINIDILRKFLSLEGYSLSFATSGEKALKIVERVHPDLILLDIMMPGISGFELCRILKSNPDTQQIPVIFMTALSSVEDKLEGFRAGAVDYVTKPIQEKEVLARVRTHLALYSLQRDLESKNAELAKEIQERKKIEQALRKSEENYRTIFNSVNDAILVHEIETHNIIDANQKTLEMFGYSIDEIKNMSVSELSASTPQYTQEKAERLMEKALKEPQVFEWKAKNKLGESFWIEVNLKTGLTDSHERLFAVVRNISERKKVQEELQKAKEDAESANRAKSTFLAHMSHELRTPLNAILGFTQIMRRSLTSEEDRENINIIHKAGKHLLSLINDVLDMSKIEAGKTTLDEQDTDLYELFNEISDLLHLKAQNKLLEFSVNWDDDVPQYVYIDGKKLKQILINLLNNAIKFTQKGIVSLQVDAKKGLELQNEDIFLYFKVIDTGDGIAEDEIEKVFNAFDQTATGRSSQEGSGLGLAISQKFAQMMGGNITVKSKIGEGTIFEFSIRAPVIEKGNEKIEKESQNSFIIGLEENQPIFRILIVDDKMESRQVLFKLLKPLGFELKEARNGQELIELLNDWHPHLIWMDINMPVMDGYQAVQHIKVLEKYKDIVVIAMTTTVFENDKAKALSAGFDDFLHKPFHESDIFDLMGKYIGVRYVYEKSAEHEMNRKMLTPENLLVLPIEMLDDLEKWLKLGAVESVNSTISDINLFNSTIGNALFLLADDFKFREILSLLNQAKKLLKNS